MPLHTSYRPTAFRQVVGNADVVSAIRANLKDKEHSHVMGFFGPSGCGKTTMAYLVAGALGSYDHASDNNPNFREINASSYRGMEMIHAVETESSRTPLTEGNRVFFFDEAHKLTPDAQEAFLKILENASKTPNYYIFATTEPGKFKDTFKRRITIYNLTPLSMEEIKASISHLAVIENMVNVPDEVFEQIAVDSMGSLGIALGILEAVGRLPEKQMLKMAKQTAAQKNAVIDLCRGLMNPKTKWADIAKVLQGLKEEQSESLRYAVQNYASAVMLSGKSADRAFLIVDAFSEPTYATGFAGIVKAAYMALNG